MPQLLNKETGAILGSVSDRDLELMIDELEETERTDDDYFVDGATIDLLRQAGASAQLLDVLTRAVGSGEGLEVRYEA